MANYGIKIDLQKLKNTFLRKFTGRTATKNCLCIPLEDNPTIFLGDKGCYLNVVARESPNSQFGDTHYIAVDMPKDIYEKLTDDERKAIPILGNMRPIQSKQLDNVPTTDTSKPEGDPEDDLPF